MRTILESNERGYFCALKNEYNVIYNDIKKYEDPDFIDGTFKNEIESLLEDLRAYRRKVKFGIAQLESRCSENNKDAKVKSVKIEELMDTIELLDGMEKSITDFTEMHL